MKKKPTKKEINSDMGDIRKVLSNLIQEVALLRATINSYIEFKGDDEEFMSFLKSKYSKENTNDLQSMPEENKKEEKEKPKIHRI